MALKNFRKRANQWAVSENNAGSKHWGWLCDLPPCSALSLWAIARSLVESDFQMLFGCYINFNWTSFYSAEAWKPVWCCLVPGPAAESMGWKTPPVRIKGHPSPVGMCWREFHQNRAEALKQGSPSSTQLWTCFKSVLQIILFLMGIWPYFYLNSTLSHFYCLTTSTLKWLLTTRSWGDYYRKMHIHKNQCTSMFYCTDRHFLILYFPGTEVFIKLLFYSCYLFDKQPANMDNVCGVFLLFVFGGQPFYFRRVREIIIEPSLGNSQRLFSLSCCRLFQGKVETLGFHMAFGM